jgi:hypothetical protein
MEFAVVLDRVAGLLVPGGAGRTARRATCWVPARPGTADWPGTAAARAVRRGWLLRSLGAERSVRPVPIWVGADGERSLDIGDMGPQPPAQEQFAVPGWRPGDGLMPREEEMRDKAAAGGLVEGGAGPFDVAGMKAWTGERTVRAAVLRHLLIEDEWAVDTKGVRLRGVRIHGHLDLEAATLRCPLSLQSCYFDSLQPPALGFCKGLGA